MDVEMIEKGDEKISFIIRDMDPSIINAIRRCAMEEVPVLAIEDVEFRKNQTALYDEILAHRLGLIPLKTDLSSYNLPEKCKCGGAGCAMCQLKLTLEADGEETVLAAELKPKDLKAKPAFPKIPIAPLAKGQKLELEATAILGRGKEHMKWSPCLAYYKNFPVITIDKKVENPEEIAAKCPKKIFVVKNGKLVVDESKITECHLCDNCVDASNGAIRIERKNDYIFTVESWGQLSPKEIVSAAADIFLEKVSAFEKEIAK